MKIQYNLPCNIAQTLNIIGDRWSLLILYQLLNGHDTYKEVLDNLEGIPTNLLSERLKTMEVDKLISRELYQSHPPRYKYCLTEKGYDLQDVFNSIILWGERNLNICHKKLIHKECNHSVKHKYYCSHCNKSVSINEIDLADPEES